MSKPKGDRRRESVSMNEKREPLEIVVSFSLDDPPSPTAPDAKATDAPAKKTDADERPPIIFRF